MFSIIGRIRRVRFLRNRIKNMNVTWAVQRFPLSVIFIKGHECILELPCNSNGQILNLHKIDLNLKGELLKARVHIEAVKAQNYITRNALQ